MSIRSHYTLPPAEMSWSIANPQETVFRWEYDDGRDALLALYEKGKKQQWNAQERIDWSLDLDPDNPMQMPDETISLFGSDIWNKLGPKELAELRRHMQS